MIRIVEPVAPPKAKIVKKFAFLPETFIQSTNPKKRFNYANTSNKFSENPLKNQPSKPKMVHGATQI
jgi:hypothetical protein